MILKRIILFLVCISVSGAMAADNEPWWNFGPNCLFYSNFSAPRYVEETIRTDQSKEEVNGITYYVVKVTLWEKNHGDERPATKENIIHMRKDGQRILLIYEEYKQLMQDRGYDMTDFDELCQYEVTNDNELVLYDFGIQVGYKFRSVQNKEDIYVIERHKEFEISTHTQQDTLDVITLSNGVRLLAGVGYKAMADYTSSVPDNALQGQFFDYLNLYANDYGKHLDYARWNWAYICEYSFDGGSSVIQTITQGAKTECQGNIYDLQGRRLTGKPTKWLYIQDGQGTVLRSF